LMRVCAQVEVVVGGVRPAPTPTWEGVQEPGCFDAYPDCPFAGEGAKTAGAY